MTLDLAAPAYRLYLRRLRRGLQGAELPRHVGVIMDGNRRWARRAGLADTRLGHRQGARHLEDLLAWCEQVAVTHVTVFVCSTENLARRDADEVEFLMQVIEELAGEIAQDPDPRWRLWRDPEN